MSDKIVIHMRLGGSTRKTVEEVREMCSLPSNCDAVRYLMTRGIESLSPQLNSRAFLQRIEKNFSQDELLKKVKEMAGEDKG